MIKKINEEDLLVFELLSNPISATEILFSDLNNLSEFKENEFSKVRKYQYYYLSYDTLLYEDKNKKKNEIFKDKKGLAESYILGGRLTGKTCIGLIIDALLALLHKTFRVGSVSSADAEKIKKVMEKIFLTLEYHPIFKLLKFRCTRNPYRTVSKEGVCLESVNNNISGKNPGGNWHGRHDEKNWEEEASYLINQVTHEKLMAQHEEGCIFHYTGMTIFTKESPMGKIFYDFKNKNKIINYSSYINPTWNEEKEEDAIKEFGGRSSPGFQVQILGQVIESGDAVFDIERIRKTYITDKDDSPIPIKSFEINKNNFHRYKDILIIERPTNAEKLVLCVDIGEGGAPSEYIVLSQTNEVYKYIYNITTFKLTPEEEKELSKYLMELLKVNIFGIDNTSGVGKSIVSYLIQFYPENIIPVNFNSKIAIDFEREGEDNHIKYDKNGNTIYKEEYIVDWSIQCLKNIFYNDKIKCLVDLKLDSQFDGIVIMKSGMRTMYKCKTANHLFQAFQVFAIIDWQIQFKNLTPVQPKKMSLGVFN